jgi:hypothetical protein
LAIGAGTMAPMRLRHLLTAAGMGAALASLVLSGAALAAPGALIEHRILRPNEPIENSSHQFKFELKSTGHLELRDQVDRLLWRSPVSRPPEKAPYATLSFGELTVKSEILTTPTVIFSTRSGFHRLTDLLVQDDGNVVIYNKDDRPLWATHTVYNTLEAPSHLDPTQNLVSSNGRYRLVLGVDGNLVEYDTQSGSPIWATHTAGCGGDHGARFMLTETGQLWVLSVANRHLCWWNDMDRYPHPHHAPDHSGAKLTLRDDGRLVASADGHAFWAD